MTRLHRPIECTRWSVLAGVMLLAGCNDPFEPFQLLPYDPDNPSTQCSIDLAEIFGAAAQDGIPALTDPLIVPADHADAAYLKDDYRVIGVRSGPDALAIPLNILWYHEVVNIAVAGREMAITHCPLTGSSLAFLRPPGVEFGVSGLLYRNNLMMFDRVSDESMWPQLSRGARCGPLTGTDLTMHPVIETTWSAWREMSPNTWVISDQTGYDRAYFESPYGDYDQVPDLLWPSPVDTRRFAKERTLGVVDASGGVGYPFGELERLGPVGVVHHVGITSADGGTVVFWDRSAQAAMAYSNVIDAVEHSFSVIGDEIVDAETGSVWRVDGVATSGPLEGTVLDPVAEAYVAFWFGWAGFEPATSLWEAP